jgi:hypothetical protein
MGRRKHKSHLAVRPVEVPRTLRDIPAVLQNSRDDFATAFIQVDGQQEGPVSSTQVANAPKRRSSRISKSIMLAVQSVDTSRAAYREQVTTGSISCHGCTYKMRHEPRPGDIVVLDMGSGSTGHSGFPSRARVKSIQKLNTTNNPTYNVGVELEIAGNIWGISSPPADWFPRQSANRVESASHGRELQVIARTEPQRALARTEAATPVPVLKKSEAAAVLSPWFTNLMNGLSNQVQIAVSEIAAMTLANERQRLLDEFRFQIQNEATGTIEHVIATSKDELARRALKVLNEGAQAIVTNSQGTLVGAIERHIESAQQNLDTMATGTVERVERNLEASRTKSTERFVLRLREQVAPLMEEARADFQKLVASQAVLKQESLAIYRQVTDQLDSDANARLLQTHRQLEKNSTSVVNQCNEKMLELSQAFQKIARDSAQDMIASATNQGNKNLEERAAEISSHFTDQLEGHVRNYLEFIGESIKEFPKKPSAA